MRLAFALVLLEDGLYVELEASALVKSDRLWLHGHVATGLSHVHVVGSGDVEKRGSAAGYIAKVKLTRRLLLHL